MSEDGAFGERIASSYDGDNRHMFDSEALEPTVDFLAALAGDRRALEFAIGTGRVALPLSARGVDVAGIELSTAMASRLMAKPGADRISVTIGDMATTQVDGKFGLVDLVFYTISNLLTQDEQVACFCNAAAHLVAGGHFAIEVPLPEGEDLLVFDASDGHVGVDRYDVANQRLTSHDYWHEDGRARTFESQHRYAWPAEYDLMARIAGLELQERWADWQSTPFTGDSASHISVWRKSD